MIELELKFTQDMTQYGGSLSNVQNELIYILEGVGNTFQGKDNKNFIIYDFKFSAIHNKKFKEGLTKPILAHGLKSVALVVSLIGKRQFNKSKVLLETEVIPEYEQLYVLKLSFENKNFDFFIGNGSSIGGGYIGSYNKYYKKLPDALLKIYFYGENILDNIPETSHKYNNKYHILLKKNKICFTITEYYHNKIDDIGKTLLNLVLIVNYLHSLGYLLLDLKFDNIKISNNLIKLIDYNFDLLTLYKLNNKNIIFNEPFYTAKMDNYLKKIFNIFLGLNNNYNNIFYKTEIEEKILLMSTKIFSNVSAENYYYSKYIYNLLQDNSECKTALLPNKILYYISNVDFLLNKYGLISIAEIIITLLFTENNFFNQIFSTDSIKSQDRILKMNTRNSKFISGSFYSHINSYQNTNDIFILLKLFYGSPSFTSDGLLEFNDDNTFKLDDNPILKLSPILDISIDPTIFKGIKYLLIDPCSECGLLGLTYYNVPPFYLVMKYLIKLFIPDIDINSNDIICKKLYQYLIENAGITKYMPQFVDFKNQLISQLTSLTEREIDTMSLIDKENLTYEKWVDIRTRLQLEGNPFYHSNENIILPSVNSRFEQNEFVLHNEHRVYKWIIGEDNIPKKNEYWQKKSPKESILIPTIVLTVEDGFHPFIITHKNEAIVPEHVLPINTLYTFTEEYNKELNTKGNVTHIPIINEKNKELLKKLEKIQEIIVKGRKYLEAKKKKRTKKQKLEYITEIKKFDTHLIPHHQQELEIRLLHFEIDKLITERTYQLNAKKLKDLIVYTDNDINNLFDFDKFIRTLQIININIDNTNFFLSRSDLTKPQLLMLNYTKEKIIDDLKHKQLLTLERQFSTITNKIINEYTRSIIIEKYINEGIIQMNTDKILQEIQDVIVQFRIEEFQRKSLQELEQLQDTILEYFKIPPEWVISEKLHTPSQRSDSKKWVRAPLIPISAYDKYLKYKYKYLKLKEELSKN